MATDTGRAGQCALGQTAPLNASETIKAADGGLNVRRRVEDLFAREGMSAIPPEDLKERLKWWGLYTQRRQGMGGDATQAADPA
jgi:sulfite reductase (ferredoxin)